ncbi:MAG: isoprenylcysteine carboxylmethyltransferase family protein [Alphaproteobacteria bacterium]|nr:isoprenylcysteine carboxylmethyltransferase family protein [Alphaproteobacteria bacterium]
MAPLTVIYRIWDVWILSWIVAGIWSARTIARPLALSQAWRDAIAFAGALILFNFSAPAGAPGGGVRATLLAPLWLPPAPLAWAFVGLTAAGLGFCWWARLRLGPLWSGVTALKAGQTVVDTGPYALVRHPIYTGMLTGLAAMALLKGTLAALIGLALAAAGLWLRARLEERFLRAELGADAYDAYSRRTPMLVPFVTRGR